MIHQAKLNSNDQSVEKLALVSNNDYTKEIEKYDDSDAFYNEYYYDTLDYDEKLKIHFKQLDPSEKHCHLVDDLDNDLKVLCTEVPPHCNRICDKLGGLSFQLAILKKFSFAEYDIQESMEFRFKNLNSIENAAFKGLKIRKNVKLTLSIEGSKEIDLKIFSDAFSGLNLETNAMIEIIINNYNQIDFMNRSILDIKYSDYSSVSFQIHDSNRLIYRTGCMQSLDNAHSLTNVMIKLNSTQVKDVVFEKHSFSSIRQEQRSIIHIEADEFERCSIGRESFSDMRQSNMSTFFLNLKGNYLRLSEQAFKELDQAFMSSFIVFFQIANSPVCVKANTFSNIRQAMNSTMRLTFTLSESHSLVFNKHSINNFAQGIYSKFEIYALKLNQFILESESIVNMIQREQSFFEVWVSKAKTNFRIKHIGIKGFVQAKESTFSVGFSSSKTGYYDQSPNAFSQFTSEPTSQVIYDFSKGARFNLNFAPKPVPRFLPIPLKSESTDGDEQESIEEISYRIFPNLGRRSRPEHINLASYSLEASDFCKIARIPFDVQVKLRPDTECSCPVYFLYRILRKTNKNFNADWLNNSPDCYQNKFKRMIKNKTNSFNIDRSEEFIENVELTHVNEKYNLKALEDMCHFDELVKSCKETNRIFEDPTYDFSQSDSLVCDASFDYYIFDASISSEGEELKDSDYIENSENTNENIIVINQYDDEYEPNNEFEIQNYDNIDSSNIEIKSKHDKSFLQIGSNNFRNYLFEKISILLFFITGVALSVIFGVFMLIASIRKLRGYKHGFIEYTTEAVKDRYYGESDTEHVYSSIPAIDKESYNSQLVTSVKSKLDKKNQIKYSKFEDSYMEESVATEVLANVNSINIKNNPFV